ncbi:hypothetical protein TSOC_003381 [Tetrabaena socialis]|uniref:Uncharacterized protein n=1 Tax=Tetrabaena socialis TaxID=47790 RepID=A0A2J8ABQ3_9CHLO|nr:hypothetical protein TSOC_003381 [Tetrabaena socialis]|eukprot:PNH09950.1 hypothetical protein TSOC_003381 [Tetrabaena socialis]
MPPNRGCCPAAAEPDPPAAAPPPASAISSAASLSYSGRQSNALLPPLAAPELAVARAAAAAEDSAAPEPGPCGAVALRASGPAAPPGPAPFDGPWPPLPRRCGEEAAEWAGCEGAKNRSNPAPSPGPSPAGPTAAPPGFQTDEGAGGLAAAAAAVVGWWGVPAACGPPPPPAPAEWCCCASSSCSRERGGEGRPPLPPPPPAPLGVEETEVAEAAGEGSTPLASEDDSAWLYGVQYDGVLYDPGLEGPLPAAARVWSSPNTAQLPAALDGGEAAAAAIGAAAGGRCCCCGCGWGGWGGCAAAKGSQSDRLGDCWWETARVGAAAARPLAEGVLYAAAAAAKGLALGTAAGAAVDAAAGVAEAEPAWLTNGGGWGAGGGGAAEVICPIPSKSSMSTARPGGLAAAAPGGFAAAAAPAKRSCGMVCGTATCNASYTSCPVNCCQACSAVFRPDCCAASAGGSVDPAVLAPPEASMLAVGKTKAGVSLQRSRGSRRMKSSPRMGATGGMPMRISSSITATAAEGLQAAAMAP